MLGRRAFLAGAAAVLAPRLAEAEKTGKVPRIGYLSPLSESADAPRRTAFVEGLRDHGYIEGRNVAVEWRFADGKLDRLPDLLAALIRPKPDVLVAAGGGQIALAARKLTSAIPIVMTNVEDPVKSGLVASLARPGGNVTGLTALVRELSAKRLELLKDLRPRLARVAVLWNVAYPEKANEFDDIEAAARTLAIQVEALRVQHVGDLETAVEAAAKARADALITLPDPLTNTHGKQIIDLARQRRLPTMF